MAGNQETQEKSRTACRRCIIRFSIDSTQKSARRKNNETVKASGEEECAEFVCICLALFCVSVVAAAQVEPKRGPSTQEERQKFVALTHKMLEAPLDESVRPEIQMGARMAERCSGRECDHLLESPGDFTTRNTSTSGKSSASLHSRWAPL
jgi:hypothetical protein